MIERIGRSIFAAAVAAIGLESILCANASRVVYQWHTIPIIPFLPPIAALSVLFGLLCLACGVMLAIDRRVRTGAQTFAIAFLIATLVFDLPRYAMHLNDISLRTVVFEPLALASLSWMLPSARLIADWRMTIARSALAISLVVFGVDHWLALPFIAQLVPSWIPWHVFWAAFFGIGFVAAGIGLTVNRLRRWSSAGMALMFGIWVVTLHLPRTLGVYHIPGATQSPAEWSSLFIALALMGGFLSMAGAPSHESEVELQPAYIGGVR